MTMPRVPVRQLACLRMRHREYVLLYNTTAHVAAATNVMVRNWHSTQA